MNENVAKRLLIQLYNFRQSIANEELAAAKDHENLVLDKGRFRVRLHLDTEPSLVQTPITPEHNVEKCPKDPQHLGNIYLFSTQTTISLSPLFAKPK